MHMQTFKSKKALALIAALVVMSGIAGLIFNAKKPSTYKTLIKPTELLPFVSRQQARVIICDRTKGEFFDEICKSKYYNLAKNNREGLTAMLSLVEKINNRRDLSDYQRYLLAQLISASLPTKDSPLAYIPSFSIISGKNIVRAQEVDKSEDTIKAQMKKDLEEIIYDLPQGDNAWVINVMISKYKWVNGERQPIYSEEYAESFDPFSGVDGNQFYKNEDERDVIWHMRSFTNSQMLSQTVTKGSSNEQTSEEICYSFTIGSRFSVPKWDTLVPPQYFKSYYHFTENNYKGENTISDLLSQTAPENQSADRMAKRNAALDFIKTTGKVEETDWARNGMTGESYIIGAKQSLDKIKNTDWGDAESLETAYEKYFWLHLENPKLYPDFWQTYNSENMGEYLHSLPLGKPVDVNAYLYSPGVADFYENWRKNGVNIPTIYDVMDNIDNYQNNLNISQPTKQTTGQTITSTAWGLPEDWDSAYEGYFWMHVQEPGYANFWDTYNAKSGMGAILKNFPLGEPVNLRDYFSSPEVREYYEILRKNKPNMPSLAEFMDNIDNYQANLEITKPTKSNQENPEIQNYPDENIPIETNPQENSGSVKKAPDGTRLPDVLYTVPR